jgi:Matrixin
MPDFLTKLYSFFVGITISLSSIFFPHEQTLLEKKIVVVKTEAPKASSTLTLPEKETPLNPEKEAWQPIPKITPVDTTVTKKTTTTGGALIPETTVISQTKKQPTASTTSQRAIDTYDDSQKPITQTSSAGTSLRAPCTSTITYRVGAFDSRFSLTKNDFLQHLRESSSLWNKAAGKTLFTYDEQGELIINLIYDERQMSTQELFYLSLEIQNTKKAADDVRLNYEADKKTYLELSDTYSIDVATYNEKFKAYNDRVLSWNEKGGAPKPEYDAMMDEKSVLSEESIRLAKMYSALSVMLSSINERIKKYNDLVAYTNTLIAKNNSYGTMTFTEGRYSSRSNTIDIYQYSDIDRLKRVLTHEFGHVLTLDHDDSPTSIMYYMNSGTSTTLSPADIQDLKNTCRLP